MHVLPMTSWIRNLSPWVFGGLVVVVVVSNPLVNVGNLIVRGSPSAPSEGWVIGNENITAPNPRTGRIKSSVAGQADGPNFRVTRQALHFGLILLVNRSTECSEQMLQPGRVSYDGNFIFGTGCQPLHHCDASIGAGIV